MRVAITGASGLIGSTLSESLRADGHDVQRLVRREAEALAADAVYWDPATDRIDARRLEGVEAVVHLAGESLIGVWTDAKKRRIRESRVRGTALLAGAVAALRERPRVFVSASGAGYYGVRSASDVVDETGSRGNGFLAETAAAWEAASAPVRRAGIRVAYMRSGMVLSRKGGALQAMLPAFKLGIGGRIGSGEQPWSWISLEDEVRAIRFLLEKPVLDGAVNATAPNPATNAEFTAALGEALGRPTFLAAPSFAVRLFAGEMAENMALGGQAVLPRRLLEAGFEFRHPDLRSALRAALD